MSVGGKHQQCDEDGETNELMSESYSRRSWKGIAIAFLVIGAVAAIVTLIVIYSSAPTPSSLAGTLILSDVINGKYSPKTFSSSVWVSNDTFMYMQFGNLMSHNVASNSSRIIVHNSTWGEDVNTFYPSPSGKYILYPTNVEKLFRYSYTATFNVITPYDSESKNNKSYQIANGKPLQYSSWGPGDQLIYVLDNDIYYLQQFDSPDPKRVTNDGLPRVIFNGVPDWVYEEEILSSESALWWSPDGKNFAFLKFNDTEVNDMYYINYGKPNNYYTSVVDIKYPKPGFNNPVVSVWVASTSSLDSPRRLDFKDESFHYVTSVVWASSSTLAVMWGPRNQNKSHVSLCEFQSSKWNCTMDSEESSPGWLETRTPLFSRDGKKYFLLKSNQQFKHIHMNVVQNPGLSIFLTHTNYEVTDILYYDDEEENIYYLRTDGPDGADKRRLYRLNVSLNRSVADPGTCLSCKNGCDWASVSVGTSGRYYALTCSSPTSVHTVEIYKLDTGELVLTWETNDDLKKKLANQTLSTYLDYTIPVSTSDPSGDQIKMRVWVPQNFSKTKKYPALIYVYGGPGSQMVQNGFVIDFGTYLVTNKNYLYVEVDGRGSGFRGDKILYQLYKRLGTVEIQDQITAMRFLLRNQSFVDPNRIAIWGWSYGGYAAAMTLAQGKDVFTCAMSVAPVTSWHLYDSVYTERYMLQPKENEESYRTSELMNYISDFRNKPFLLMHGTADDNVHLQQSVFLTKALNNASILFDMHIYPDENHSIPKSKLHVYLTLEDFLKNCFS